MIFLFIDEVQCTQKENGYFGVGLLAINSNGYKKVKTAFDQAIRGINWNPDEEFKGECIFSATSGDRNISVDQRIELTTIALGGLLANKNARAKYSIFYNMKGKSEDNYLKLLNKAVSCLPKPPTGAGKNLVLIVLDKEDSFSQRKIIKAINTNIKQGYTIVEEPYFLTSKTGYCGLVLVDIINYLKTWIILNPSQKKQLELFFKGISDSKKIKVQKATDLLSAIKNISQKVIN
jgi:hypothetical protein